MKVLVAGLATGRVDVVAVSRVGERNGSAVLSGGVAVVGFDDELRGMACRFTINVVDSTGKPWGVRILEATPVDALTAEVGPSASPQSAPVITPARLRGKVVDLRGRITPRNAQVVLFGSATADARGAPIVVTTTDSQGNFMAPYPRGAFARLTAVVSTSADEAVDIATVDGSVPEFVFVVLDGLDDYADQAAHDACACNDPVPRLPDAAELLASDRYTQDIGGSCVNFTTPNRALEEFAFFQVVRTTDPLVGGSAQYAALRIAEIDAELANPPTMPANPSPDFDAKEYGQAQDRRVAELRAERARLVGRQASRGEIDAMHAIDWDDTPTTYESTTVAHGHLLHFRQVWRADGYSMGDLVYSLALAPGQKKQVVVVDWERRESASRTEESTQREAVSSSLIRDRDVHEIVNTAMSEVVTAASSVDSTTKGWSVGAAVAAPAGPVMIGAAGGYSSQKGSVDSTSMQDASRSLSASAQQHVRDATMQAASSVRSQRATVVQTMQQGETMSVTAESVANYNHCHALTIQYFEVLRHFAVSTEFVDVQECLFVPLPMSKFDDAKVVRWMDVLARAIPAGLRPALESCQRFYRSAILGDHSAYAGMPQGAFCDEPMTEVDLAFELDLRLTRPAEVRPTPPVNNFDLGYHEYLLLHSPADHAAWQAQLGFLPGWAELRRIVLTAPPAQRDAAFAVATEKVDWVQHFVDGLSVRLSRGSSTVPLSGAPIVTARSAARDGGLARRVTIRLADSFGAGAQNRRWVQRLTLQSAHGDLPSGSWVRVVGGRGTYRTAQFGASLFDGATTTSNDLASGLRSASILTPIRPADERRPRAEDLERRRRLLEFLDANIEAVHRFLWMSMSPDRRFMMLDGFHVAVPSAGGAPTYRSIASVVENRVIGVVGNSLVMPVVRGYNLDPSFRYDAAPVVRDDGTKVSALLAHYQPDKGYEPTPFRISVPTRGVFAEAVMGACNACEKKDDTRFWRWEESPVPDSPTAIAPVDTNSRRADPGDLTARPFATPMVQIQNAPAVPDPSGLGAAIAAITNAGSFRDQTGLAGGQQLAATALATNAATLQSTIAGAGSMANVALQSRQLELASKQSQRLASEIGTNPNLTPDQKSALLGDLYSSAISGQTVAQGNAAAATSTTKASPGGFVGQVFGTSGSGSGGSAGGIAGGAAEGIGGSAQPTNPLAVVAANGGKLSASGADGSSFSMEVSPTSGSGAQVDAPDGWPTTATFWLVWEGDPLVSEPSGITMEDIAERLASHWLLPSRQALMAAVARDLERVFRRKNGVSWVRVRSVESLDDVPKGAYVGDTVNASGFAHTDRMESLREFPNRLLDAVGFARAADTASGGMDSPRSFWFRLVNSNNPTDAWSRTFSPREEFIACVAHEMMHTILDRLGIWLHGSQRAFTPDGGNHLDSPLNLNSSGETVGAQAGDPRCTEIVPAYIDQVRRLPEMLAHQAGHLPGPAMTPCHPAVAARIAQEFRPWPAAAFEFSSRAEFIIAPRRGHSNNEYFEGPNERPGFALDEATPLVTIGYR